MPTYPINELISQAMVTTLSTLIGDSPLPGYTTNLTAVERFIKTGNSMLPGKAVLYEGTEEAILDVESPIQTTDWRRRYEIFVCITNPDRSDIAFETLVNAYRADVSKVLLAEVLNNTFLGGNCINIWDRGAVSGNDANDAGGVLVLIDVDYRTYQFDPYQLG